MAETIIALATLITATGAVLVGWRNSRKADEAREKAAIAAAAALTAKEAAEASKREIVLTKEGVFEVGKQIDGRLSELLKLTEDSAFARGQLAGPEKKKP